MASFMMQWTVAWLRGRRFTEPHRRGRGGRWTSVTGSALHSRNRIHDCRISRWLGCRCIHRFSWLRSRRVCCHVVLRPGCCSWNQRLRQAPCWHRAAAGLKAGRKW